MKVLGKRKFIGRWVILMFNGVVRRAKIVSIYFHQELRKPVFRLVSELGNTFQLTREELTFHEISR